MYDDFKIPHNTWYFYRSLPGSWKTCEIIKFDSQRGNCILRLRLEYPPKVLREKLWSKIVIVINDINSVFYQSQLYCQLYYASCDGRVDDDGVDHSSYDLSSVLKIPDCWHFVEVNELQHTLVCGLQINKTRSTTANNIVSLFPSD